MPSPPPSGSTRTRPALVPIRTASPSPATALAEIFAAVVAQQLKGKVAFQMLIYPVTDFSEQQYASREKFGGGEYLLSIKDMEWFGGHLSGGNPAALTEAKSSPMASADLSGLAPAVTITAGYDPPLRRRRSVRRALTRRRRTVRVQVLRQHDSWIRFHAGRDAGSYGGDRLSVRPIESGF